MRVSYLVRAGWCVLWLASFAQAGPPAGTAQRAGESTEKTASRISLGRNSNSPGTTVSLPLYFTAAPKIEVGKIILEIGFPSRELEFVKAEPEFTANVEIKPEKRPGSGESRATVQLEISSSKLQEGVIAGGLLGQVVFKISDETQPGSVPVTIPKVTAYRAGTPSEEVKPVAAFEAAVEVVPRGANPYIGCFFFSH